MSDAIARERRFRELLGLFLEEDLRDGELRELVALAKRFPEFTKELQTQLLIDSCLWQYESVAHGEERFLALVCAGLDAEEDGEAFTQRVVELSEELGRGGPWFSSPWGVAGLVSGVAACLMLALLGMQQWRETTAEMVENGVGVVTHLSGELAHNRVARGEGETLGPGTLVLGEDGYATVEFYRGAQVSVAGPAVLELVDAEKVICHAGKIRAVVPEIARGFTIITPSSEVVDLGTEFAVEVGEEGSTEIHVFDGEVEAWDRDPDEGEVVKRVLTEGQALKMERADRPWEAMGAEPSRFADLVYLGQFTTEEQAAKFEQWQAIQAAAREDDRLIAYYDFQRERAKRRMLPNYAPQGTALDGVIVGAKRSDGPWPGKDAVDFKSPSDRVRIHIPGEYQSLTLAAWVKVDGLDRTHSSLLLTDGYDLGELHWQIKKGGTLVLG
ncbi:MAG: FecR domain-containing protein, partial [Verrucomicrobiota bacterium]